jgi:hypothetical protein
MIPVGVCEVPRLLQLLLHLLLFPVASAITAAVVAATSTAAAPAAAAGPAVLLYPIGVLLASLIHHLLQSPILLLL